LLQVTSSLVLLSGLGLLGAAESENTVHWGYYVIPWLVILLLPCFTIFTIVLAIFELYYEIATGKGASFKRLLTSLRLPSQSRADSDIRRIHRAISHSDFLKVYPYSKLCKLCRTCELLELKPEQAVFSEGEAGYHFYVLIKGSVDVYVTDQSPPHSLKCVNSLHDSGSFGELALIQVISCRWRWPMRMRRY
jgi:hypothetical protein